MGSLVAGDYLQLRKQLVAVDTVVLESMQTRALKALSIAKDCLANKSYKSMDFISEVQKRIDWIESDLLAIDNAVAITTNHVH